MSEAVPKLGGRAAWIALMLVSLAQAMSMVDRQVLAILVPRIKADLHIADAEMGLLYGTVFALFYAIFSLPLGRLADGWVRTRLLGLSIFGWSLMTALAGFANSFGVLALSRLGVGIGEASAQPAGMSLLADSFPKSQRGIIGAAMSCAVAVGIGAALLIGGSTADWWDKAWPIGAAPLGLKGWQAAFIAAAIPGLVLSVFILRMPEPRRGAADGIVTEPDPHPFRASTATLGALLPITCWLNLARLRAGIGAYALNLAALALIVLAMHGLTVWTDSLRPHAPPLNLAGLSIGGNTVQWSITGFGLYVMFNWLQGLRLSDKPAFVLILKSPAMILTLLIAALQTLINYGVMGWIPTYLIQHFHQSPTSVGVVFGPVSALVGIIGPLVAGPIADWAYKYTPRGRMWVTAVSLTLSPIFAFLTFRAPDIAGFYFWFVCYGLVLTLWLPSIYATFLDLVLPRMRGVMTSLYILLMTIIGLGLGPYTVGMASDLNGGDLGSAILSVYWIGPLIVVLTFAALWRLPQDEAAVVERARAAGEAV
jgi:MFS family permease